MLLYTAVAAQQLHEVSGISLPLRPGENVPPNRLSPISAARTLPDLTLPDRPDIVCYVENASITAERERDAGCCRHRRCCCSLRSVLLHLRVLESQLWPRTRFALPRPFLTARYILHRHPLYTFAYLRAVFYHLELTDNHRFVAYRAALPRTVPTEKRYRRLVGP